MIQNKVLLTSFFLLFGVTLYAQDYFISKNQDTTWCLLLSEELLQNDKLIYTDFNGNRDTLSSISDSIQTFSSHSRTFELFDNKNYYWLKSDGKIKFYQSIYFKMWTTQNKYDVRLFPKVRTLLPGTHIGEKADLFRSIVLVIDKDTITNPTVSYFKKQLFPKIKSSLQYFPKKFKFSYDNIELLIQLYNNKKKDHYEYFIDGKQDTVYCTALFYQFYYSELSKFNYSDDYDVIFFNRGRKNCLKFGDFSYNGLNYRAVTHKDFEIKNFQYGHYFVRQSGELDLLYFGLLIPYFNQSSDFPESNMKSYFILQSERGINMNITEENFKAIVRPLLEKNDAFMEIYKGNFDLSSYSIDEMISLYNYTQHKKALTKK